jgi:hypothetical protein
VRNANGKNPPPETRWRTLASDGAMQLLEMGFGTHPITDH